jgi:hypothetical protein
MAKFKTLIACRMSSLQLLDKDVMLGEYPEASSVSGRSSSGKSLKRLSKTSKDTSGITKRAPEL